MKAWHSSLEYEEASTFWWFEWRSSVLRCRRFTLCRAPPDSHCFLDLPGVLTVILFSPVLQLSSLRDPSAQRHFCSAERIFCLYYYPLWASNGTIGPSYFTIVSLSPSLFPRSDKSGLWLRLQIFSTNPLLYLLEPCCTLLFPCLLVLVLLILISISCPFIQSSSNPLIFNFSDYRQHSLFSKQL